MYQQPTPTVRPGPSVIPTPQVEQRPEGLVMIEQKPASCMFVFFLIFSTFWNIVSWGMVAFFLFTGALTHSAFSIGWFALIPAIFCIVGLILIAATIRTGMVARGFGPGELIMNRMPLRLGEQTNIRFRQAVRGNKDITAVEATLTCREWVRYRVGTDTRTESRVIWSQNLGSPPMSPMLSGGVDLGWAIQIPADQPPSFSAPDNALEWQITVTLKVARFPDPTATFLLPVLPEVIP